MEDALEATYLDRLSKNNTPVSVYLINGIKLSGVIAAHDLGMVILRDNKSMMEQLIYKHAISTIVPKLEDKK
jgi:host factor-I protein